MSDLFKSTSESFIKSIDFDNQIASDKQKYGNWVLGIATAGIALLITQESKIIADSIVEIISPKILLRISLILNSVSLVIGASSFFMFNKQVDYNRQSQTLVLRQELFYISGEISGAGISGSSATDMIRRITLCDFLENEDKKKFSSARLKSNRAGNWAEKLLISQQICTSLSYAIIVIVAYG